MFTFVKTMEDMVTEMNVRQMKESARKLKKEDPNEKLYGVLCVTTDSEQSSGVWKIYTDRELANNWFDEVSSYFSGLYDILLDVREESLIGEKKLVETWSYIHGEENETTVMTMYEL